MRRILAAWCALMALVCSTAAAQDGTVRRAERPVPNSYIVVLADDEDSLSVGLQSQAVHGGRLRHVYEHAVRGFSIVLPPAAAQALARDPRVRYVEEDGVVRADDTQVSPPWGLDRIDQRTLPLNGTYNYPPAGPAVFVHVIDTGIRTTHLDFGGRAFIGGDFIDDDGDGDPNDVGNDDGNPSQPDGADCNGHGTHVAGTIGGATYGVAKNVTLIGYRALNCSGDGTVAGVIAAIDRVTADTRRPAVANMSLGGGVSTALDNAVRASIAAGITYSLSSGNEGIDASLVSPARVGEAITVGATNQSDQRPSFSNFGPVVDIFAPGVSIRSAYYTSDSASALMTGTSMASPHVAGVAALYLQVFGNRTPAQVRDAIVAGATAGIVIDPAGSPNRLLNTEFVLTPPPPPPAGVNAARASNGGVATASSTHAAGYAANATNNGDRKGLNIGSGGVWGDVTRDLYPDWVQIQFAASYLINRIDVFTMQDAILSPAEPTPTMTFVGTGVRAFDVQYWNGSAWVTVPGGSVTGNSNVWRTFTFTPVTTDRIRVLVNASATRYSFLTEIEAWGEPAPPPPPPAPINVARASNGGVATASSLHAAGWEAGATINGDRKGLNIGAGGVWADSTRDLFPDWVQVQFSGSFTINRIDVVTMQDSIFSPVEPTASTTFTGSGVTAYSVQYWNGAAWVAVGSIAGNNNVWRTFTFPAVTTDRIRVLINGSATRYSFLTEIEAWTN